MHNLKQLVVCVLLLPLLACSESSKSEGKNSRPSDEVIWKVGRTISASEDSILGKSTVRVLSTWRDKDNKLMANLCTGVVVSKRIVLSAANCFSDQLDIEPVQVVFPGNKTYVESNTLTGSVEIHPKYDDNDGSYNLAVIRLNEDIPSQAQPIEIGEVEDLASLKRVYTGGYGLFYVVKPAELWEQQIHFSMEDGLFRFTSVDGRESCKGDDGGPIVSVDEGGKARLVGITTLSLLDCTGWNLNHLPMYKVKDYLRLYLAEAE